MIDTIIMLMEENHAPDEQYIHLGLGVPNE